MQDDESSSDEDEEMMELDDDDETHTHHPEEFFVGTTSTCQKGHTTENAMIYRWIFYFGPLWVCIFTASKYYFTILFF